MSDPTAIAEWANKVSVIVLLAIILIGGYRQWWVWGWHYRAEKKEKLEWKTLFLRSIGAFSEAVTGQRITPTLTTEDEDTEGADR